MKRPNDDTAALEALARQRGAKILANPEFGLAGKATAKRTAARKPSRASAVKLFPPAMTGAALWAPPCLLTLDVASRKVGWAVFRFARLETFGVLGKPAGWEATRRIDGLVDDIADLCTDHRPSLVCMEFSSGHTAGRLSKASGLSVLGAAQGAVRQMLRDVCIEVVTVSESAWTGSRRKESRTRDVRLGCPEYAAYADAGRDAGMDGADALGIAWHYLNKLQSEARP